MSFMIIVVVLALVIAAVFFVSRYFKIGGAAPQAKRRPQQREPLYPLKVAPKKVEPTVVTPAAEKTASASADSDEVLGIKEAAPVEQPKPLRKMSNNKDLVQLNVFAAKGVPYKGYDLMQSLIASGMRHGDMNIFHRHERKDGKGPIMFSLACAEEPGVFDLTKMGAFECSGLVLFMQPSAVADPVNVFELMMEVAGQLAQDLGGVVLDQDYQVLTTARVVDVSKHLREKMLAKREKNQSIGA